MSHFQPTTNSYPIHDSQRGVSKQFIETPQAITAPVLMTKGGNDEVLKHASSSNSAVQANFEYFSSNKFTIVSSPCPLMPSFLSSAHFYCGETDYVKISKIIQTVLSDLTDKYNYSWKCFDREFMVN